VLSSPLRPSAPATTTARDEAPATAGKPVPEQPAPAPADGEDPQRRLAEYYAGIVTSGLPAWQHVLRHPRQALAAAADIRRLPDHDASIADTPTGRALVATMTCRGPLQIPLGRMGVAVLEVPADPAEYRTGASKQTLRRKVRLAERSGVTWRPVDDPAERAALLQLADAAEAAHADEQYRVPQPDNGDLLGIDLWLVAYSADGRPLLLSVTPTSGEWGHLRYFRTLGSGQEYSDSRYLMTQALVDTLAARGVRHVVDGVHPVDLSNGLRHFQRMVGWRLARVRAQLVPAPVG
jgi:hypothetical protein